MYCKFLFSMTDDPPPPPLFCSYSIKATRRNNLGFIHFFRKVHIFRVSNLTLKIFVFIIKYLENCESGIHHAHDINYGNNDTNTWNRKKGSEGSVNMYLTKKVYKFKRVLICALNRIRAKKGVVIGKRIKKKDSVFFPIAPRR